MDKRVYEEKSRFARKTIIIASVAVIFAILLIYLIFGNIMVPMRVNGISMKPTLTDQEMVYVNKLYSSIEYGDILVFNRSDNENLVVKRVIGKPNDVISVIDGKFHRNGKVIEDDASTVYLNSLLQTGAPDVNDKGEFTVPRNSYFLVGDNRANSYDSRNYGSIRKTDIVGKVLFK